MITFYVCFYFLNFIYTFYLLFLKRLHNGPKKLSQVMRDYMKNDPISPILWEPHFTALDRRVAVILKSIRECVAKVGVASSPVS